MTDKSPLFYARVFREESTAPDWGGYFAWGGVEIVADAVEILEEMYAGHRTSPPIFLKDLAEIYESWITWEVDGDLKIIEGVMAINPDDLLYYRLHLDGNSVYTERLVEGNWTDRTFIFSYSGPPGRWFDLTFDQLGRPFICWEVDGQVWVRWYNPISQMAETWNICAGRTPVCSIDTFHEYQSDISDILLFYIDDEADRVKYRLQRDRYLVEYETELKGYLYPVEVPNTSDKDLIYAHMASNWRFYLWYRIKTETTFTISYWHSAIYPIPLERSKLAVGEDEILSAHTLVVIWWYYPEMEDEEVVTLEDEILSAAKQRTMFYIGTLESLMAILDMTEEEVLAYMGAEVVYEDVGGDVQALEDEIVEGGSRVSILTAGTIEDDVMVLEDEILEASNKLVYLLGWAEDDDVLVMEDEILSASSEVA